MLVGRYAYFAPFGPEVHTYASRLIRLDLGFVNVIDTYDAAVRSGGDIRNLIDVMDLTQANPGLGGFSGIFNGMLQSAEHIYQVITLLILITVPLQLANICILFLGERRMSCSTAREDTAWCPGST